ncbi:MULTISPECIES: M48 family metallopeptidase [unclassified Moraxella]|uniref:M48 family metallopeptidase n=1 Tax=unclassified Moraxella TaxID=2685852 RepID=UPI003AF6D051
MKRINSQQDFDDLVRQLEIQAHNQPKLYQKRVMLLAMLGNLYLWGVVLVTLLMLGLTIWLTLRVNILWAKLFIGVLPMLWMVGSALFIRAELPDDGLEIEREDAPALFEMIDELRDRLKSPKFHHVHITDELNAGVMQVPKGLLGGTTNYLILGLPLMQALSVDEFKAVLAHEFGHLSKSHARFFNWIYRQRLRFSQIMASFEDSRRADWILRPFLNWYIPYFNAYSFPLARANEYEADRISAQLTSPQIASQALTRLEVIGSYRSEKFWQAMFADTKHSERPTSQPYRNFVSRYRQDIHADDSQRWLNSALAIKTDTTDTHPSLNDRLTALNSSPQWAMDTSERADSLLAISLDELVNHFDQDWQQQVTPNWKQEHEYYQQDKKELMALQQKINRGETLTIDEHFGRLQLAYRLDKINREQYQQHIRALLNKASNHVGANYTYGRLLLNNDDEKGVSYLQTAMQLNPALIGDASEAIRDFYWRIGHKIKAEQWHQQYINQMQQEYEDYLRHHRISTDDDFVEHRLTADQYQRLTYVLQSVAQVKQAYVAKRLVGQNREVHVVIYKVLGSMEMYSRKKISEIHEKIEHLLPKVGAEILLINVDEDEDNVFIKNFKSLNNAKLK